MISDGELWSGEVEKALRRANERRIPVFAVGVGTLAGGPFPVPPRNVDDPVSSRLDRAGLQRIAAAARGEYFELDRDGDRHIANAIVDAGKRLAPSLDVTADVRELYWYFIASAAAAAALGLLFLRDRAELWVQLVGSVLVLLGISSVLG